MSLENLSRCILLLPGEGTGEEIEVCTEQQPWDDDDSDDAVEEE